MYGFCCSDATQAASSLPIMVATLFRIEQSCNLPGNRLSAPSISNGDCMPCAAVQQRRLQHPMHWRHDRHADHADASRTGSAQQPAAERGGRHLRGRPGGAARRIPRGGHESGIQSRHERAACPLSCALAHDLPLAFADHQTGSLQCQAWPFRMRSRGCAVLRSDMPATGCSA